MHVLAHGDTLQNRYQIVRTLGHGGMGAVYLATHVELGRLVAIKELRSVDAAFPAGAVRQFRAEAQILHDLRHPNLPRVYDFLEVAGSHYLVMDYIAGRALDDVLLSEGAPAEDRLLQWAGQICDVLHYLHTRRPPVIFRDLKPSNVMLTDGERVKLIDFGIAKFYDFEVGPQTQTTARGVLSRGYAAPEQYGGGTDARSDLYSLGATLYCLLTCEIPPESVDVATGRVPPVNVRRVRPDVSERTARAIESMMQVDRSRRPSSARAVMAALGLGDDDLVDGDDDSPRVFAAPSLPTPPSPPPVPAFTSLRELRESRQSRVPGPAAGDGARGGDARTPPRRPPAFPGRGSPPAAFEEGDDPPTGRWDQESARPAAKGHPSSWPPARGHPSSRSPASRPTETRTEAVYVATGPIARSPSVEVVVRPSRVATELVKGRPDSDLAVPRRRRALPPTFVAALAVLLALAATLGMFGLVRSRQAAPPAAILDVSTDPPGAVLWVDGVDKGVTPLRLSSLAAGRHEVRIEHEACVAARQVLELHQGETQRLRVALQPLAASATPAVPRVARVVSPATTAAPAPRPTVVKAVPATAPVARPTAVRTVSVAPTVAPTVAPRATATRVVVVTPPARETPVAVRTVDVVQTQAPVAVGPPQIYTGGPTGLPGAPTMVTVTPGMGVGTISLHSAVETYSSSQDQPFPFEGAAAHLLRRYGVGVVADSGKVGQIVVAPFDPAMMQRVHFVTAGGVELGSPASEVLKEFGKAPLDRLRGNHLEWTYPSRGIAFHIAENYVRLMVIFPAR